MNYYTIKCGAVLWHSFKDLGPKFRAEYPIDQVTVLGKDFKRKRVYVAGTTFGMWCSPSNLTKTKPRIRKPKEKPE